MTGRCRQSHVSENVISFNWTSWGFNKKNAIHTDVEVLPLVPSVWLEIRSQSHKVRVFWTFVCTAFIWKLGQYTWKVRNALMVLWVSFLLKHSGWKGYIFLDGCFESSYRENLLYGNVVWPSWWDFFPRLLGSFVNYKGDVSKEIVLQMCPGFNFPNAETVLFYAKIIH